MYARNTKDRAQHSQEYLRSKAVKSMHRLAGNTENDNIYDHTYSDPLPAASAQILEPVVAGLTGNLQPVNRDFRELLTVCMWQDGYDTVISCCVVQPEVASATCTIPLSDHAGAVSAMTRVVSAHPGAPQCRLRKMNAVSQMSGRMAPYVVSEAGLEERCKWGFANMCKSKVVFVHTHDKRQQVLSLTRASMSMLEPYMPSNSSCVVDSSMSCHKITTEPGLDGGQDDANKNTCLLVYGDGTVRIQGTPAKALEPCRSFRQALILMSQTKTWYRFLRQLSLLENFRDPPGTSANSDRGSL